MRNQIEEIKDKLDILEVARSYFGNLRKTGSNFFTLCPFHQEKTPSFSINPELGIYKCFGCGESGDVISLIQQMENLDFPRALEIAAEKAGVQLQTNYSKNEDRNYKTKKEIIKINTLAADFYNYILLKHKKGKEGYVYANKRNLDKNLIIKFKIGFAPNSYTNLLRFLKKKGYSEDRIVKYGLAVRKGRRVYDKFRSRLIFPLINSQDEIIGFSGRNIVERKKAPKYLHSPSTPAFEKSRFLFGLNFAKTEIRKKDFLIFCEGQLDVISSYKTKIKNIVAPLGTAITQTQLSIAKRYTKNHYFCFDNDLAGESALIRAGNLAYREGIDVKAISLPQGKDADDLINKDRKAWEKAVEKAEPLIDNIIKRLIKRLDLKKIDQKYNFLTIIAPLLHNLQKEIEKNHYIHKLSYVLNVEEDILVEEFEKYGKGKNIYQDKQDATRRLESPVIKKEEYLLSLILQHLEYTRTAFTVVSSKYFSSPMVRKLYKSLKQSISNRNRTTIKKFASSLSTTERSFLENLLLKDLQNYFEDENSFKKEMENLMASIKKNYYRSQISLLKNDIEKAESGKNDKKVNELLSTIVKISGKLKKL